VSAFILSHDHIAYLVNAAVTYRVGYSTGTDRQQVTRDTAAAVGAALFAENVASVTYRYDFALTVDPYVATNASPPATDPVQVLKAVQCYEYQTCEHPGWLDSAARLFCEHLTSAAIGRLPGYEDAAWEITPREETTT